MDVVGKSIKKIWSVESQSLQVLAQAHVTRDLVRPHLHCRKASPWKGVCCGMLDNP